MKEPKELEIKIKGKTKYISPGKIYLGTIPVEEYILFVFNTNTLNKDELKVLEDFKKIMEETCRRNT